MHNDCLCCIHKCCRRTVFARHKYFSILDNNSRLKTIDSFQFPNLSATALSAIVNKNLALWLMLVQNQLKIGNLKANWINNTWVTLSTQTVGVRWVVVEMSHQKLTTHQPKVKYVICGAICSTESPSNSKYLN